ncbi:conserved transmembrane alanine RICH protein [Rhodococcus phenolicus]|uniref:conserved transmembrane alanine RICH protein n=1 Tax=Rhodococcus phenolicus TaxID=263849 RepID=UPI00082EAC58|nr:conserved transmembrane alanine RICH protein [Rhodococcus phenolicus]
MPPHPSPVSRRTLLRWSGAALGSAGLLTVAGCGTPSDETDEPDPLIAQAERARTDAALAGALVAVAPDRAEALATIGAERTTHAEALDAEVARLVGATPTSPTTPPTAALPAEAPTVELLRERLTRSQRDAANLARTLRGYRAGLLASVSAACATETAVLLP